MKVLEVQGVKREWWFRVWWKVLEVYGGREEMDEMLRNACIFLIFMK